MTRHRRQCHRAAGELPSHRSGMREAKLVERALQQSESVGAATPAVTPQKLEAFSRSAKELLHGSNRAPAKQALQSIVVRVEVTDETIRIFGENDQLSRLVASEGSDPEDGSDLAPGVRGYVRRWRRECPSTPIDVQAVFRSGPPEPTVLATGNWRIPRPKPRRQLQSPGTLFPRCP
jgi:hypothetical protein